MRRLWQKGKQRERPKPSEITNISIRCGACGETNDYKDGLDIYRGSCRCDPDTMTCMCDIQTRIRFTCQNQKCKYYGEVEVY